MLNFSITPAQRDILVAALDQVIKTHGVACLQNVLPVLGLLQDAAPEVVRPEPSLPKLVEAYQAAT